jgi:adenine phosphoribosyltransferase
VERLPAVTSRAPPKLRQSLKTAPIVQKGDYPYFVSPITDGVPRVEPEVLDEVIQALASRVPDETTLLLCPEAMGIHLASCLSLETGIPYAVARKRAYGLNGETIVGQKTGYGESALHLNDINATDRVMLIDDVASTGGTIRALAKGIAERGARLLGVLIVVNKGLDLKALSAEIKCPIHALANVRINDGRLEVH